ncbi:hypothetical protein BJ964_007886 [Actinoplanes lobatus]|uniref:Uncharacterized protein n=1 Tax=Actinoplanes lobatus TaxID=113568 RepID=A0A7W7HND0_9ACTN|nr:hypothetical protein [Actinoplanes lobatus]
MARQATGAPLPLGGWLRSCSPSTRGATPDRHATPARRVIAVVLAKHPRRHPRPSRHSRQAGGYGRARQAPEAPPPAVTPLASGGWWRLVPVAPRGTRRKSLTVTVMGRMRLRGSSVLFWSLFLGCRRVDAKSPLRVFPVFAARFGRSPSAARVIRRHRCRSWVIVTERAILRHCGHPGVVFLVAHGRIRNPSTAGRVTRSDLERFTTRGGGKSFKIAQQRHAKRAKRAPVSGESLIFA